MSKRINEFIFILGSLIFYSCSAPLERPSIDVVNSAPRIPTLEQIENLKLGTPASEIRKQLGEPTKVITVPKEDNKTWWTYSKENEPSPRASLIFDRKTNALLSKTWEVRDGDPEQKITQALHRYPQAHFKYSEAEWINPHIAPDEAYYEDKALGLTIEIRMGRQEVDAITWYDPKARAVAEAPKKKYKKYRKTNGLLSIIEAE